jgi:hypothetical protein
VSCLLSLGCLVACKKKAADQAELPTSPPPPPAADAAPGPAPIEAQKLPAGFPLPGAPALSGTLSGKPFKLAKAIVRVSQGVTLALYDWSEGDPCEPQFAPEDDQLYVSAQFPTARFVVTTPIASTDDHTFVIYKRPTLDPIQGTSAAVVFDEIGASRAKGRLILTGPDNTSVAGSFEATVCSTPQKKVAEPPTIHGLAWGTDVGPAAIPSKPVTGVLLGSPATPLSVEVVDWKDGRVEQHEVHFFTTKPAQDCAPDQFTPGFKIGFPSSIVKGQTVNAESTLVTRQGSPFAAVLWQEPGNVLGMETTGWVSARIDSASATEVRGRVVAWFKDASKSMIVGAFTAKRCTITP